MLTSIQNHFVYLRTINRNTQKVSLIANGKNPYSIYKLVLVTNNTLLIRNFLFYNNNYKKKFSSLLFSQIITKIVSIYNALANKFLSTKNESIVSNQTAIRFIKSKKNIIFLSNNYDSFNLSKFIKVKMFALLNYSTAISIIDSLIKSLHNYKSNLLIKSIGTSPKFFLKKEKI
jgi:hypothetical protein